MAKYLDLEKLKYNDKIVEIDDEISDAILELNKKGYKTYSSCSGHSNIELYQYSAPLSEKQKIIEWGYTIFEEGDLIYSAFPSISTYCYIKFDDAYNFTKIPDGFIYETATISKRIDFFDEFNKRKSKEIIDNEIKKSNEELTNWAKQLEPINNIEKVKML